MLVRETVSVSYTHLAIRLKRKQPKIKETVCMHINDAIGFRMEPEVVLKYSLNCFGTADAICFRNKTLRIHDLKTGESPAKKMCIRDRIHINH